MSTAITILTQAAQSEEAATDRQGAFVSAGTSVGVDSSGSAIGRVVFEIRCNLGCMPEGMVAIDTAPTQSGPWTEVYTKRMTYMDASYQPSAWDMRPRAVVPLDAWIRTRWRIAGTNNTAVGLTLGVTATGIP